MVNFSSQNPPTAPNLKVTHKIYPPHTILSNLPPKLPSLHHQAMLLLLNSCMRSSVLAVSSVSLYSYLLAPVSPSQ